MSAESQLRTHWLDWSIELPAGQRERQPGPGGRGSPAPGQVLGGPLREVVGPGQAPRFRGNQGGREGGAGRGGARGGASASQPRGDRPAIRPAAAWAQSQPAPPPGHGAPRRLGQDTRGPAAAGAGAPAGGAARYARAESGVRRGTAPGNLREKEGRVFHPPGEVKPGDPRKEGYDSPPCYQ